MDIKNLLALSSVNYDKFDYESAWTGHIPFAYWLVAEKAPKIIVELGSHYGNSYFAFCRSVKDHGLHTKCYAIDTWGGDEHAGEYSNEVFSAVSKFNDKNFSEFSFLVRKKFDDAVHFFADSSIDILHIDGLHTYEAVKNDFEIWFSKLAPGAVILFHDTCANVPGFGVDQFWEELKQKNKYNFEFYHSHGLGVIQLESSIEKPLFLLSPECTIKSEIRDYFVMLGDHQLQVFQNSFLTHENLVLKNKIKDLEWYLETRVDVISNLSRELQLQRCRLDSRSYIKAALQFFSQLRATLTKLTPDPHLINYIKQNGLIFSVRKALFFIKTGGIKLFLSKLKRSDVNPISITPLSNSIKSIQFLDARFLACRKISFRQVENLNRPYINVITDSIGKSSLFGGVGTALIFAVKFANKNNCNLRVITRTETASPSDLNEFMKLQRMDIENDVHFVYAGPEIDKFIEYSENDLFLTTSWWTTSSILDVIPSDKILYLIQEDERMFYPFGDDRLRAEEVMQRADIRFLVNSKILFDHFSDDLNGIVSNNWDWFEPAFPDFLYKRSGSVIDVYNPKKKFFFYARPNNSRNLFARGLEVIDLAIERGVISLDNWDIYFVGRNIPNLSLSTGYTPKILDNLSWKEYAEFISQVDAALCLMYTPHPSYPPLDLAKSGAVVVSNKFGVKTSLDNYSKQIILSDLNSDCLLSALSKAIEICDNGKADNAFGDSTLNESWDDSFAKFLNKKKS